MAATELQRAPVTCPHCGHTQMEPVAVISTVCRACQGAIQVRENGAAARRTPRLATPGAARSDVEVRSLACFECGTMLTVPVTAESTMCKRCSSHIDLRDYVINQAVSKNFRTHGRFVVREKGYVFNTDSIVGEAIIKGRFHGRLTAKRRLEIHSGAEIKGTFATGLLVIPAGESLTWASPLHLGGADVLGELSAALRVDGTVFVRATGRLFGDVRARHVFIEDGAVVEATLRVGPT